MKIDDRGARQLKLTVRRNPSLTSKQILADHLKSGGTPVSTWTIRRTLKRLKLRNFKAQRKPFVNSFQRFRRIRWAKKFLYKPLSFWRRTVFSDETQICLFQGGKNVRVYRGLGEGHLSQHLSPTVKHSPALMIWGCMSYKGTGRIAFLEPNRRMNSEWYSSILEGPVQNTIVEHFGVGRQVNFQDDGAPCHRSRVVEVKCNDLGIRRLEWPGQSPDANPIENLWKIVKNKVRLQQPQTVAALKDAINDVWNNGIPVSLCQHLIGSMQNRLHAIIRQHGYPTKY
jgi:hypothetical protein